MKSTLFLVLFSLALAGPLAADASAQGSKTVILVRHAEKDASPGADQADPVLSSQGAERAERFMRIARKYRPGAVHSTNFKRTKQTAEPIARRRKLEVLTYDPRAQAELVKRIMESKTKRHVVVGHSNTIPQLANLLAKKELFKSLDESEYGTIWVIRMKNGQPSRVEVRQY